MGLVELFLIAVGLSMDAFAVAVCKGLAMDRVTWRQQGIVGLYFGLFQGVMPLIGYYLGAQFESSITAYDHWIAFILLGAIGGKMVWESLRPPEEDIPSNAGKLDVKTMLPLAVATSIDALAVGISFAFLEVQIAPAVAFIGVVTFLLSFAGVKIGQLFGLRFQARAELAGGVILILMGFEILLEHLGYIRL